MSSSLPCQRDITSLAYRSAAVLAFAGLLAQGCGSSTNKPDFVGGEGSPPDATILDPADIDVGGAPSGGGGKDPGPGDTGGGETSGSDTVGGGGLDTGTPGEANCDEKPYDFGCPCEDTSDCESGFCIESLTGYVCTNDCVETCPDGWNCLPVKTGVGNDVTYVCVPKIPELCAACASDDACGGPNDRCVPVGAGGNRCGGGCAKESDCPDGYACEATTSVDGVESTQCVPVTGSCECTPELDGTKKACFAENEFGICTGQTTCDGPNGWTTCNATVAAPEICDGIDNNCNGVVDEEFISETCFNTNQFGTCPGITECRGIQGAVCEGKSPAAETCDGLDNNCDGKIDEGFTDTDGDGVADCVDPDIDGDGDPNATDCAPFDPLIFTGAAELCDGVDNNCSGQVDDGFPDLDGDEVADCIDDDIDGDGVKNEFDCAPMDPNIYPGAQEVCDGVDNNCNGQVDEGEGIPGCTIFYFDADQDGFAGSQTGCFCSAPPGYYAEATDCDDTNSSIYPGAPEVCNKIDDNCNGLVDEGAEALCVIYYFDGDQDGWGVEGSSQCTCGPDGLFSATKAGDCDDTNQAVHPGALEVCNGLDDNCNGQTDEGVGAAGCSVYFFDGDGDGYGVSNNAQCLCGASSSHSTQQTGDCNDNNASVFPGAQEICNGIDDNCNTFVDEGCDDDGDGWCDANMTVAPGALCLKGGGDCNDNNPNIFPGAQEICNGVDDNCSGEVDEGVQAPCGGCSLVCQLKAGPQGSEQFTNQGYFGVSPDPDGQLKLDVTSVNFHMLWVANSGENTLSKIDTESGKEVARYRICGNPSRTAVDLEGNCWAGCRDDGGVAKILLDPSTCPDKNGNGVIETSADFNGDGVISGAELLAPGADECVVINKKVDAGENIIRAVAVDKANHPWVGGWNTRKVWRLDPQTGNVLATVDMSGVTNGRPYGFAIDQSEQLWVSLRDSAPGLGLIDLKQFPLQPKAWGTPGGHNTYGIAVDSLGKVWLAGGEGKSVSRFNPDNNTWTNLALSQYPNTRGVAASVDGKVYVAHHTWGTCAGAHFVSVFNAETLQLEKVIDYSAGGVQRGPVGLSFDFSGNLWAINQCGSSASKLNPETGAVLGTFPTGAGPYTYSDMTGFALKTVVAPEGSYIHTFKGWEGLPTQWFQIVVGATTPPGTSYEVEWRAADDPGALGAAMWVGPLGPFPPASMPIDLTAGGPKIAKWLQVKVTLIGSDDAQTPLLKSIDVVAAVKQ